MNDKQRIDWLEKQQWSALSPDDLMKNLGTIEESLIKAWEALWRNEKIKLLLVGSQQEVGWCWDCNKDGYVLDDMR
jgi:hypothetical protein